MADWDDVRRIAATFPEMTEGGAHGHMAWLVRNKLVVWERPLRKADLTALGDTAPEGPILAARVSHELDKEVLTSRAPDVYFTTPHFDGYPAILVRLEQISVDELADLVADAWQCQAPARLADEYRESGD